MRYRIRGHIVKSENAAKPHSQRSTHLTCWLREHVDGGAALDYGCGKLRYARDLYPIVDRLTLVDSEIQLSRAQKLEDLHTSIRRYVDRYWPRARCLSIEKCQREARRYDFVLCANVLSAIPVLAVRNRILKLLASSLRPAGQCLIVNQYRNSDFEIMRANPNATDYLDGWLLRSLRGTAFYGIITPEATIVAARACGHTIVENWTHEGVSYVLTECA
jgi:SAM-dependent methyltransferase